MKQVEPWSEWNEAIEAAVREVDSEETEFDTINAVTKYKGEACRKIAKRIRSLKRAETGEAK